MKQLILAILLVLTQVACSDVKLAPYESVQYLKSASGVDFCTTPAGTINSNLKFIVVMDKSTSNQLTYDPANPTVDLPGTDENGARRYSALLNFVQNYTGDQAYTYWSLINFSTDARRVQDFTTDKDGFENLIDQEWIGNCTVDCDLATPSHAANRSPDDDGFTNYMSALDRVTDLIEEDIEANRNSDPLVSSTYIIFFISDGAPYVAVNGQLVLQDSDDILGRVRSLATLEQTEKLLVDSIQFNTAYYYGQTPDQNALDLLRQMSAMGGGSSYEFSNGARIDFSQFAVPVRISRFALKEIWIANSNTVWNGNRLVADSDADGLSNGQEFAMGSNPFGYDSDGNGVGDGVEYKYLNCTGTSCNVSGSLPYTQCGSARRISASPLVYADTDKDFLNDCEERLLGTEFQNPDSNFDYVPDWFAFVNNVQMIGGNDLMTDGIDQDGVINYFELKQNTPVNYHNGTIPGIESLRYTGRMVSTSANQDCHNYSITNLPFHSQSDRLRVMIFENTRSIDDKVIFRAAEVQISPLGVVYVSDQDLQ